MIETKFKKHVVLEIIMIRFYLTLLSCIYFQLHNLTYDIPTICSDEGP